jgi:hypothetical protein
MGTAAFPHVVASCIAASHERVNARELSAAVEAERIKGLSGFIQWLLSGRLLVKCAIRVSIWAWRLQLDRVRDYCRVPGTKFSISLAGHCKIGIDPSIRLKALAEDRDHGLPIFINLAG